MLASVDGLSTCTCTCPVFFRLWTKSVLTSFGGATFGGSCVVPLGLRFHLRMSLKEPPNFSRALTSSFSFVPGLRGSIPTGAAPFDSEVSGKVGDDGGVAYSSRSRSKSGNGGLTGVTSGTTHFGGSNRRCCFASLKFNLSGEGPGGGLRRPAGVRSAATQSGVSTSFLASYLHLDPCWAVDLHDVRH